MLKYIIENLRQAPNSILKDSLWSLFTNLHARRHIKYNPNTDKFEIQRSEVHWKLPDLLEQNEFFEPKKIEKTNIFIRIDSNKIYFWLE